MKDTGQNTVFGLVCIMAPLVKSALLEKPLSLEVWLEPCPTELVVLAFFAVLELPTRQVDFSSGSLEDSPW